MTDTSDDSRAHGIELGSLAEELEEESYPMTKEEVLERYGDHEIDLQSGKTTVDEILDPEQERDFEDPQGVRQAIFNMVGDDAVGREGYSDRGGSTPDEDGEESAEEGESV